MREMSGENVEKMCATKHDQNAGKKTGRNVKTSHSHPEKGERANREHMQGDAPVYRRWERQNQKQAVRRIKKGSLHRAEIGRAPKNIRVPERKISFCQLAKAEVAPGQKLQIEVGDRISHDARIGGDEHIAKHGECQREQ